MVNFFGSMVEGVGMGEGPNGLIFVEEEGGGGVMIGFTEFVPDVGARHEGDLAFCVVVAEEDEDGFLRLGGEGGEGGRGSEGIAFAGGVDDVEEDLFMGHATEDALAEEEAVLFHAADGIEVGEEDFAGIEDPAIETSEVSDFEKFKDLFCLRLDLGNGVGIKARGCMVEGVAGGEVFFTIVEDLIVGVGGFDFGRDESDGGIGIVGVLEENNGEFFAKAEGFEEGLVG